MSLVAIPLAGCGSDKPRPLDEIKAERLALPALYLTLNGEEVIAPRNKGDVIVDPASKQLAFRAYTCNNPQCPGRGKESGSRPFLFIWHDPLWFVNSEGELEYEVVPDRSEQIVERGGHIEPTCPECLTQRNPENEDAATRQQYRDWVTYYVFPETAKRQKELDEEHRQRLEYIKENRHRN